MNGQLIDGRRRVVVKKRISEVIEKRLSKDILITVDKLNAASLTLMSGEGREAILEFDFLLDKIIVQCSLVAKAPIDIGVFAQALGIQKFRILDRIEDTPSLYTQYCDTTHKMLLLNREVSNGFNEERLTKILEKALTDATWSWRKLSTLARMCDCDEPSMYSFIKLQPKVYEFSEGSFGQWIIRLLVSRDRDISPQVCSEEIVDSGDSDSFACDDESSRDTLPVETIPIASTRNAINNTLNTYTFGNE